jgi:metal-responsive CopG/Arc/MetJ family transcriptional regulator
MKARGRGRPKKDEKMVPVSVMLPNSLVAWLDKMTATAGGSRSARIREIVEERKKNEY